MLTHIIIGAVLICGAAGFSPPGPHKHQDLYECNSTKLAAESLCYMVPNENNTVGASPNGVDRTVAADGWRKVVDSADKDLKVSLKPWTQGDHLAASSSALDGDTLQFSLAFEMVAPLRNAMMYAPKTITENFTQWTNLTSAFNACKVKDHDVNFTAPDGHAALKLSVDHVYLLVQDAQGQDTHHQIMQFLEEGARDLVCLMTSLADGGCDTIRNYTHTTGISDCWKPAYASMYGQQFAGASVVVV